MLYLIIYTFAHWFTVRCNKDKTGTAENGKQHTIHLTVKGISGQVTEVMERERICIVIPSYNNATALIGVVKRTLAYTPHVIVVNDGSTDETNERLTQSGLPVTLVDYAVNHGKGYALKEGFKKAILMGFEFAITIDADGQYDPEDIPRFISKYQDHHGAFLVGTRVAQSTSMSRGARFINFLSNFWFHFQTGKSLSDTRCGYRLYPLSMMDAGWIITSRYEAELELLVYSAWKGIHIVSVPVSTRLPERKKHPSCWRTGLDFMRITLLSMVLTMGTIGYFLPSRIFKKISH